MSVRARSAMAIAGCAAGLLACLAGSMRAAADYPLTVTLDAKASTATATRRPSASTSIGSWKRTAASA
jgi:hypothetical protein